MRERTPRATVGEPGFLPAHRAATGAEVALRDSDERYRTLLDAVREIVCTVSVEGRFLSFNPALRALTGWSEEDWVGREFAGLLHPDDLAACFAAFEAALRGEMAPTIPHRLKRRDGSWLAAETTPAPLLRDGRVVGVLGVVRDVTDRVRADVARRESELRYQHLVDAAQEIILTVDPVGRFTSINPAFQRLTGWRKEEWIGRPFHEIVHGDDLGVAGAAFEAALRGEAAPSFTHRVRKSNGDWLTVESTGTPQLRDGRVVGVLGISRDVTERARAAEDLRRSRRLLEAAEEVAHVGSWEYNFETGEVTWSDERYRLLGLARETCPPSWEAFIERVHPADRDRVTKLNERTKKEGGEFEYEARVVRPNGVVRFIQARGHAVHDANGRVTRMIGITQDITERKQGEAKRRHLFRRLTFAHEEERTLLSRELHDGPGQSLAALLVGLRRVEDAKSLAEARVAGRRQRELVAQTIDEVSRLARGLRPAVLDDLGLRAALERHAAEQERIFGFAIAFEWRGLGRQRLPRDVETALYRIVQEALANVARHSRARRVTIAIARSAKAVRLAVSDDGCGFDVASSSRAGTDHLGLTDMRERAALVGGAAEISSRPGNGTKISVVVPLK
jgi:PAS domain S-box-containing protein